MKTFWNLQFVLVLIAISLAFGFGVQPKYEGPDEVELSLLEPAVVPDPVDGRLTSSVTITRKMVKLNRGKERICAFRVTSCLAYIPSAFCPSLKWATGPPTVMSRFRLTASSPLSTSPSTV
jgi:hypothetical protein